MALTRFLTEPLPEAEVLGFFSPHYLLRSLLYEKLKADVRQAGDEYCFHIGSDPDAIGQLHMSVQQLGLFTRSQSHCVFFCEKDLASAKVKQSIKKLQGLRASGRWPLVFVGNWKLKVAQKKLFPKHMLVISEPRLDQVAELSQIFKVITQKMGLEGVSFDHFARLQAAEGDISQAVFGCLKEILVEQDVASLPKQKRRGADQVDIFSFTKRILAKPLSSAEALQLADKMLSSGVDWYPFLGIMHRLIQSSKPPTVRRETFKALSFIDNTLKHFYPSSKQSLLFVFYIIFINKVVHGELAEGSLLSA